MTKRDTLSRAGAHELAAQLDAYWHKRGWPLAKHTVELVNPHHEKEVFCIRSNLVRGLPPK